MFTIQPQPQQKVQGGVDEKQEDLITIGYNEPMIALVHVLSVILE
ncbi:MAG: hypothetical protein WAM14_05545 [Candidatus Nitrosopolaris sp.]